MPQPFTLQCIGRPALFAPDGSRIRLKVNKHLALLTYLAVEPKGPHRRDHLADLLWPRSPILEARHSLATAVSVYRAVLGPGAIESTRDEIRFACTWLSADIDQINDASGAAPVEARPIQIADLLQDLEIRDAPGFMHWRDRTRARWRPRIQAAALRLIDQARRNGDWRALDVLADRLFELGELNEQGVRAKMEALTLSGDRVAALVLYEEWRGRLETELNAVASPVMQRFAQSLRCGTALTAEQRSRPASPRSPESASVRPSEYRTLYSVWENVLERHPRHVMLCGDLGVGKSTLVAQFLASAGVEGAAISRVHCYALEQDIPYAALAGLLRGLIDSPGMRATRPEALADLVQLVPAISERIPNLPPGIPGQGESARIRIAESALQFLTAVAEEQPIVMAVDDYHLADDASLAILHLILVRLEEERVMMVFAGERDSIAGSPSVDRLWEATVSMGATSLVLEPLTEEASEALLETLLHDASMPLLSRRLILRCAKGYPLAIALLAQEWSRGGDAAGALRLEEMSGDLRGGRSEDAYCALLERAFRTLPAQTRAALDLASVLGPRLNEVRFYKAIGLSSPRAIAALTLLAHAKILREGIDGLEFVNDIVRTAAYLQVPPTSRRRFHEIIVNDLLGSPTLSGSTSGLEVSWHLCRCGRASQASEYLLRGAREAIDHGAPWEAERALESGREVLPSSAATECQLLLAEAFWEEGREREARETALAAEANATGQALPLAKAIATGALARVAEQPAEEARHCFDTLLGLLAQSPESHVIGIASRGASTFATKIGTQDAFQALHEAVECVEIEGMSTADAADVRYARAAALYLLRRLEESEHQAAIAAEELERAELTNSTLLGLYCGRGAIRCARGEYAEALEVLEKAHGIARKIGNQTTARACLSNLALCCFRLGDIPAQIRWGQMALDRSLGAPVTYDDATYSYHLAVGYAASGDGLKAFDVLSIGDAAARNLTAPWAQQSWLLCRADVLAFLGRHEEAKRVARDAVGPGFSGLLSDSRAGPYARWKARLARDSAEAQEALEEVARLACSYEKYDFVDRAEILAASSLLGQLRNLDTSRESLLLRGVLCRLPVAVAEYLQRLGFLTEVRPLGVARNSRQRRRSAVRPTEDLASPPTLPQGRLGK